jgi:mRNA-degrading endonuclease RelE of RelBE toxin-antitoxin system
MARYIIFSLVNTKLDVFDPEKDQNYPLGKLLPPLGTTNRKYFVDAVLQMSLACSPKAQKSLLITISEEMEDELEISKTLNRMKSKMKDARIGDVRVLYPVKAEKEKTPSGQVKITYLFQAPHEELQKLSPEKLEF